MKFLIEKQNLLESLKKFQGVIEKNPVIPMASNLFLEAKNNEITMSATNFEVGIIIKKSLSIIEDGEIVVDGQKILDIIREMPDGEMYIERKDTGWIEIKQGKKIVFNLAVLSDEKVPPIKVDEKVRYGEIKAHVLSELINKTVYAVSDDRTRDVLRGILVEREKNTLKMIATDGHRLSLAESDCLFTEGVDVKKGTIVPKRGAKEIRRLAQEVKEEALLKIGFGEKNLTITEGGELLMVRLIEGEFPDYRVAIPKDNSIKIIAKINELISSLKRVTLLTEEETKVVKFYCKDGLMVISSKKAGVGEAREECEVDCKGDGVEFGLNSRYMLDVLNTMEGEEVVIEVKDAQTPVLLKENGKETTLAVIMPMML